MYDFLKDLITSSIVNNLSLVLAQLFFALLKNSLPQTLKV